MLNARDRVANLVGKKENDISYKITSYMLCKKFGWDYHVLANQPIPFIFDMLEVIKYLEKEKKRKTKK
jgi:hypothetical protein